MRRPALRHALSTTLVTSAVTVTGLVGMAVAPAAASASTGYATRITGAPLVLRPVSGTTVYLLERLTSTAGRPLARATIQVRERQGYDFHTVALAQTDSYGYVRVHFGANVSAWQLVFAGGGGWAASAGAVTLVRPVTATTLGQQAVALAAAQAGKPYVYGQAGPNAFDCSGLVAYVYDHLGHALPHNALEQYQSTAHVSVSQLEPGDLVFVADDGYSTNPALINHVGIYAGDGTWWVAPHTGTVVQRQRIYTSHIWASRV